MGKHQNNANNINSLENTHAKKKLHLPIIALAFNIIPILLMLLMGMHLLTNNLIVGYFSLIMAIIWMGTGFGGLFHIVGVILAIYYLLKNKKRNELIGVLLSAIAILFPFVLWFFFITFEIMDFRMLP